MQDHLPLLGTLADSRRPGPALPAPQPPSLCSVPDTSSCPVPGRGDREDSQPLSCCPDTTLPWGWAEREGRALFAGAGPAGYSASFVGRTVWPEGCLRPVRFPKVAASSALEACAPSPAFGLSAWQVLGLRPQRSTEGCGVQAVLSGSRAGQCERCPALSPSPHPGGCGRCGVLPEEAGGWQTCLTGVGPREAELTLVQDQRDRLIGAVMTQKKPEQPQTQARQLQGTGSS